MRKSERHQLIKSIIQQQTIRTQEELLTELKKSDVSATQATISRDIRDLKIVKSPDNSGQVKFELFQETTNQEDKADHQELFHLIKDAVLKVDTAQFLTIINTLPNNAQLLSASLDDYPLPEKVATIAGFDTVVIISKSVEEAQVVAEFFQTHLATY